MSSTVTFVPAVRADTPIILGLAGPTRAGKTWTALLVAQGLQSAGPRSDRPILMINCEGGNGRIYADRFKYHDYNLTRPFRPQRYLEAVKAAIEARPSVLIIDTATHMHDGPGGSLDWHDEIVEERGPEYKASAWKTVHQSEDHFIYVLKECEFPVIICFRAKHKIDVGYKDPKTGVKSWKPLGLQPIAGRISFETTLTLMLPEQAKGVPDLAQSQLRSPWDVEIQRLLPDGQALGHEFGIALAEWAKGDQTKSEPTKAKAVKVLTDKLRDQWRERWRNAGKVLRLSTELVDSIAVGVLAAEDIEPGQIPHGRAKQLLDAITAALEQAANQED